jgi:hypothetical protein
LPEDEPVKRLEKELCGIPAWLMREYLVEAGGEELGDGQVAGEGWKAEVTKIDPFCRGALQVGMIRIEIEGEPQAMDRLMVLLEPKLMRAGG